MSDTEKSDYRFLLHRAGATDLSDADVADLAPGLKAIDGKIEALRALAAEIDGAFPDPLDRAGDAGA